MKQEIRVLYITYDGLRDPLGQSQILPYLNALAKKSIKMVILSFEKKEAFKKTNLLDKINNELAQNRIIWQRLKYHKRPCFLVTLYDVICGYINGLFLINKYRLNIVHARGYISAFIAFCLKKSIRIKFIFDMRGFWVDEKVDAGFWGKESISYRIAKRLEKSMLNLADEVIVLTEKAKLFLISHALKPEKYIEVIPTCVDLKLFEPLKGAKKGFLQNKVVILYSGSIGTFYAFKEIVEFFKIFRERARNSFFLALVNNEKHIAEDVLNISGVTNDSYKVLALSHLEVPDWVKEADVSLMFYHRGNSYAGCCPAKFAESLACGVPVIINKSIGDCDDIVEDERIGFVIEDFTESAYKKTVDQFLSILKERDSMRIRCRNIAEKFFSLERGVEKYSEVYNKLI